MHHAEGRNGALDFEKSTNKSQKMDRNGTVRRMRTDLQHASTWYVGRAKLLAPTANKYRPFSRSAELTL